MITEQRRLEYLSKKIEKIFVYDIETTDFDPSANFIIGWCGHVIDLRNKKIKISKFSDYIKKSEIKLKHKKVLDFDRRILRSLMSKMKECDLVVGHYSKWFDNPFVKTRCFLLNERKLVPKYKELKYADTWKFMKYGLKARRNTLDNLANITRTKNEKTHFSVHIWVKARYGDKRSIAWIMDHCRKDVNMSVHCFLKVEFMFPISAMYIN